MRSNLAEKRQYIDVYPSHLSPHLLIGTSTMEKPIHSEGRSVTESEEDAFNNAYLNLLRLVYDNAASLHNSSRGSNKFKSMVEALETLFPGIQESDYILDHLNNGKFDEDKTEVKEALKKVTKGKTNVQDIVAIAKADHALPFSSIKRMDLISAMLEKEYPEEWVEIMSRPLILKAANDIMVYITLPNDEVIPLYKPQLGIEQSDSDPTQRDKVFSYFQTFFSNSQLPEVFSVLVKSSTALTDQRSRKGILLRDTFLHQCHKPEEIALKTLIYGVTDETPPELAEAFKKAMIRCTQAQSDFWAPDVGINLKYVTGVNGGMKLDNPLWALICSIPASDEERNFYDKLAKGTPIQLEQGIIALLELIAAEDYDQEFSTQAWEELTPDHLKAFNKLVVHGVLPTTRWVALPEQDYVHYRQPDPIKKKSDRLIEVTTIYQNLAEKNTPRYVGDTPRQGAV